MADELKNGDVQPSEVADQPNLIPDDSNAVDDKEFDAGFDEAETGEKAAKKPVVATGTVSSGKDGTVSVSMDDEKGKDKSKAKKQVEAKKPEPEKPAEDESGAGDSALGKAEAAAKAIDAPAKTASEPEVDVFDAIKDEHPDARSIIESAEFNSWFEKAPERIRKAGTEGGAYGAILTLNAFKAAQGESSKASAPVATKKEIKSVLAKFGDVEVQTSEGKTVTLNALADEYGRDFTEAMAVLAEKIAESKVPAKGAEVKPDTKGLEQLQAAVAGMNYWLEVSEAHPDARKVQKSDEFKGWLKEASEGIRRLARSADPEHGILVLDAYKESLAKGNKGKQDESDRKRMKEKQDIHGDTLKGSREKAGHGENPDEFDDGFEKGAK